MGKLWPSAGGLRLQEQDGHRQDPRVSIANMLQPLNVVMGD
jgi:hypothetical protein